jgi:hypothetical protein
LKINSVLSPASWFIIIIATLLTGYLYWFYTHFEKVVEENDIGAIKEAKINPFYAAEKFLEKTGKKSTSQKNYSLIDSYVDGLDKKIMNDENNSKNFSPNNTGTELLENEEVSQQATKISLEPYDTLIIESHRVGLSESKKTKLKNWLSAGGHLVILATELYDDDLGLSKDAFVDELGLRLYENSGRTWQEDEDDEFTKISFKDTEAITEIHFNNNNYIQDTTDTSTFIGGNESTNFFAQYEYDEGMVTVVTDMDIWKNDLIAKHDHAMFLYQLVGGADQVWFLYNTLQPSLISIMVDLIPLVIISFIIILLLALFSASWRKGSPEFDDERIQREFMLHIEAAGEFSYRNDHGVILLKGLMDSLESKLTKSIHQYKKLSVHNKIEKLSQLTGLSKKELEILWHDVETTQDSFVEKVLLVQTIRKKL